jgi:hypothetical protein
MYLSSYILNEAANTFFEALFRLKGVIFITAAKA